MSTRIIVPAFGACDELEACLASLERTLPDGTRVLLADDASPGDGIAAVAARIAARGTLRLDYVRRPRNLGFVGNVNAALRETAPDDVILLNSDTLATPGWFERIQACADRDRRIATATPWSNNAEICSFPDFCRAAALPDDPGMLAAAAAATSPSYPELPTGVGFCMFMRRAAIDAIGDFDLATFGRGYGEENDFCLRATGHGWRNVLCDDAYVAHRGGASFGPTGHAPGGENLARLNARYPGYNALIADFIMRDPLQPLRAVFARQLEDLRLATPQHDLFDGPR
jgi:GT2 family glycosyltransferase